MWLLHNFPHEICPHQEFCDFIEFYRNNGWVWEGHSQQHAAFWTAQLPHSLFSSHSVLEPIDIPSQEQNQLFFLVLAPLLAFTFCWWGMVWGNLPLKPKNFSVCSLCNYMHYSPERNSDVSTILLQYSISSPSKNGRSHSNFLRVSEEKAKLTCFLMAPNLVHILCPIFTNAWALPSGSIEGLGLGLLVVILPPVFFPSPQILPHLLWTPLHVFVRKIVPGPFVTWECSLHILLYPKQFPCLSVVQCPECRLWNEYERKPQIKTNKKWSVTTQGRNKSVLSGCFEIQHVISSIAIFNSDFVYIQFLSFSLTFNRTSK